LKIDNLIWNLDKGWQFNKTEIENKENVAILFIFGTAKVMKENLFFNDIRNIYPNAILVGGSSAGTIYEDEIVDESHIIASALCFKKSKVKLAIENIHDIKDSFNIGKRLVSKLSADDLKHIIVLTDSINLNGSMLVEGLNANIDSEIPISGGILGEETKTFANAYVLANKPAQTSITIAIGFYGEIESFYGSDSGWDDFGTERVITKSTGNIVYEIDGEPALDLYKKYLGDLADKLPASGLRFPLNIWNPDNNEKPVIRTLMAVDEVKKSLTFVSDVPQGFKAKLMKTNIDGLIDGSERAIQQTEFIPTENKSAYCLAVSCIGRQLILDQLTEEELVVIDDYIGDNVELTGFYSYGEIAPFSKELKNCRFHNQTMTVTVITEK